MARRKKRNGNTLLELVAASTILATALVPALRMMRESLKISRDIETANLMATLSVSKLEEQMAVTMNQWETSTVSGDFAADGYSSIKFQVTRSDNATDGGIPGQLIALTSTVWEDSDSDDAIDAGEASVQFSTKLSPPASYP